MPEVCTIALTKAPKVPNAAYVSDVQFRTAIADGKPRTILLAHLTPCSVVGEGKEAILSESGTSGTIHMDMDNPEPGVAANMAALLELYALIVAELGKMNTVMSKV